MSFGLRVPSSKHEPKASASITRNAKTILVNKYSKNKNFNFSSISSKCSYNFPKISSKYLKNCYELIKKISQI